MIDVNANGEGDATLQVLFVLLFEGMWGDMDIGSCSDDTSSTPDLATTTADVNMTAECTARKPDDTTEKSSASWTGPPPPPIPSNAVGGGMICQLNLLDGSGSVMPGVWVQERFTTSIPFGMIVNGIGNSYFWTSKYVLNSPSQDGEFGPDNLCYWWPYGTQAGAFIDTTHQYWACTRDISPQEYGIEVGTWRLQITLGAPLIFSHTKQP